MMNIKPHLFTLLTFLFIFTGSGASEPLNCPPKNKKWGLVLNEAQNRFPANQFKGCQVKKIIPLSPLWYSRLRAGDWITRINHLNLQHTKHPCKQLRQIADNPITENNPVRLDVLSKSTHFTIVMKPDFSHFMHNQPLAPYSDQRSNKKETTGRRLTQWQNYLQSTFLIPDNSQSLKKELACLTAPAPALPLVKHVQSHPLTFATLLENLQQTLAAYESDFSLSSFTKTIQSFTFPISKLDVPYPKFPSATDNFLAALEVFIHNSNRLSSEAFSQVSPDERQFFLAHYSQLASTINQSYSLLNEPNRKNLQTISRLFEIAAKVDFPKLTAAAQNWFQLTDLTAAHWRNQSLPLFPQQPETRKTPYGTIILGSYGDDVYHLDASQQAIAIIIDPGGHDHYIMKNTKSSRPDTSAFNTAIIDWSGDDFYEATQNKGFASAIMGISLLMDYQGNDRYLGHSWSQGSAFAGIAALFDVNGNDTYTASHFSQASALFGSGFLIDNQGDDHYSIRHHGQALGLPYGHAVLLDRKGNDHYQSRNGLSSSYKQTSMSSESWSQGCGKGFRHILPGGIGILLDAKGDDSFMAQEFAQGGGYYYGMGLLYNLGKGNDRYQGFHYNVGYSAHQAIGGFIDSGGNDVYSTTGPAFGGSAWDQSISLFYDHFGNDRYNSQAFSLAAAAHNSIASFWDITGDDEFSSPVLPGCVSSNQYHGGHSLSYFFSSSDKIAGRINPKKQEFVISSPPMTWDLWNTLELGKINSSLWEPFLKHNNTLCH